MFSLNNKYDQNSCYFIYDLQLLFSYLYLHLILRNILARLLTKLNNELAVNILLSINFNFVDMDFVVCSLFLSILLTSFSVCKKRLNIFHYLFPKQVFFHQISLVQPHSKQFEMTFLDFLTDFTFTTSEAMRDYYL